MSKLKWHGASFAEAAARGDIALLGATCDHFHAKLGQQPLRQLDLTKYDGRRWNDQPQHERLKRTPLMIAALGGHERMVARLLSMGADAMLENAEGKTALQHASCDAVRSLLSGVPPAAERIARNSRLVAAARAEDAGNVEAALAEGAFPDSMRDFYDDLPSALHCMCRAGDVRVVKTLLEHGARADIRCFFTNMTPMAHACQHGHAEVVSALLDAGANVEFRVALRHLNINEMTPLSIAVYYGHALVVDELLKRDADVEARDSNGRTPLRWAVRQGHAALVATLLSAGSRLDASGEEGSTLIQLVEARKTSRTAAAYDKILELLKSPPAPAPRTRAADAAGPSAVAVADDDGDVPPGFAASGVAAAASMEYEAPRTLPLSPAEVIELSSDDDDYAPAAPAPAAASLPQQLATMAARADAAEAEAAGLRARLAELEREARDVARGKRSADAHVAALQGVVGVKREKLDEATALAAGAVADAERAKDALTCTVCMEKPRTMTYLPCRHLALCHVCSNRRLQQATDELSIAERLKGTAAKPRCPMCNTPSDSIISVFLP
jgi:ankyrin repeat protein